MNRELFLRIFSLAHRNAVSDAAIVFCANYLAYFLVLGALAFILSQNSSRKKLFVLADASLALILGRGILTEVIRFFYVHPRPFDALGIKSLIPESGNSFPSGHTVFFFALAMTLWFYGRRWGWVYFVLAAVVGVARIAAGVHWPLDILGGAVLGILSALAVHSLIGKEFKEIFGLAPAK